ncbi:MAG: hypothetical protein RIR00_1103 [Pseudomonadota bacterium]|jgi:CheY-like chemotaxis protein
MNILLVDDVESNRVLPAVILRKAGHQITECRDATEALARFPEQDYDCLLLDISLPGISGIELCQRLRALGAAMPIIAYTAHALASETEQIMQAGFDALLVKPITRDALLQTIQNVTRPA